MADPSDLPSLGGVPDTLQGLAQARGAPPLMRRRAMGAQMLKPGDPTYPADFVTLYNAGVNAMANNATGSETNDTMLGASPFDIRMSLLDAQKRIYDQGLGNLPPQIAQSIINNPSQSEGQAAGPPPDIAGGGSPVVQGEPYSPTPQIDDIGRLFANRRRAQGQRYSPQFAEQTRQLMKLPNFGGFVGGDNI